MKLRLRFERGPRVSKTGGKNRRLASAAAAMLIPMALIAYLFGAWRLGSDIGVTAEFAMSGIFAHWQVWLAIGGILQLASYLLNRYAISGKLQMPQVIEALPQKPDSRKQLPK